MGSHDDIVTRWADRELGKTDRANFQARSSNVWGEDGALYSYGRHFELARPLRWEGGGNAHRRNVNAWLLNADRFSVTTGRHQRITRNVLARTGLPMILVPYDALSSAGIIRDTIRPVEITDDRFETIPHRTTVAPGGLKSRVVDVWEYVDLTDEEIAAEVEQKNDDERRSWEERQRWAREGDGYWSTWVARPENAAPKTYTADDLTSWERREHRKTGTRVEHYLGLGRGTVVTRDDDGAYVWTTYRHWLGASLFRAAVRTGPTARHVRWAYFLSAFDDQEARQLYFLAELPRGAKPTTVAEAFEALKPDVVKMAETMGRDITRQGDIFAVAMPGLMKRELRKDGAVFEKGPQILEHVRYRDRYTSLGDIPASDDETVWHDKDGPGRVKVEDPSTWEDRGRGWRALLGQNHYATEVARMPDGTTFARGTLTHDPAGRDRDHARRRMGDGKTWHMIVKNTVPVAR